MVMAWTFARAAANGDDLCGIDPFYDDLEEDDL
jgi:hypothetical protein